MDAKCLTPILNVADMAASFAWFEKLGWTKNWQWGDPVSFACVGSGECEIFLCLGGQGGRGRGANTTTFKMPGDESADKGAWMSVWVTDVDAVFERARANGIEVTCEPENMPWGVRECHLRHPDGHVFRISGSQE
jgi:catechol 2,3-dioxygenase-like lactoylglutathione lyase family enzyme